VSTGKKECSSSKSGVQFGKKDVQSEKIVCKTQKIVFRREK